MTGSTEVIAALAASAIVAALSGPLYAGDLPVGDGKVTDHPASGNVFACNQDFRGGGARHVGAWFHGDSWSPAEKPHVQGRVMWSGARFSMSPERRQLSVSGNGLPVGVPTGKFPIARDDPAYAYDTNPNPISAQSLDFAIPSQPVRAKTPTCLSMGMIGFTITGVAFYNALDDAGRDAAAHEVQDLCDGHPQGKGQYHYHSSSPCLPGADRNALVGWALDGFPILGMLDASGKQLGNTDLDVCHGRKENIKIEGRTYDYAYRLTPEYPYTLGCYTGLLDRETMQAIRRAMGPPRPRGAGQPRRPRP